jgi:hypothetical protein
MSIPEAKRIVPGSTRTPDFQSWIPTSVSAFGGHRSLRLTVAHGFYELQSKEYVAYSWLSKDCMHVGVLAWVWVLYVVHT